MLPVTLALLPIPGGSRAVVAALSFVMGGAAFGATPGLQLRVVEEARDAPYLPSTMNVTAFDIGDAAGAFLGGLVVARTGDVGIAPLPVLVTRRATRERFGL